MSGPPVPGVVVSDAEFARSFRPRDALVARGRVAGGDVVAVARVTRDVVTHDVTRGVARNLLYIPAGGWVIWGRWRENHTNARYDRMIRAAETAGNWENVFEWETRAELARDRRHKRVMDWVRAPKELVKALILILFALVGLLLAMGGMVAWISGGTVSMLGPIRVAAAAIAWLVWLVAICGTQILLGLPCVAVLALWWVGRQRAPMPAFLAPERERARQPGDVITTALVVTAFRDLGITELRKRIVAMGGDAEQLITANPKIAGCGMEFDATPPRGATETGVILSRHARLAENLLRHQHEVHLSVPSPGTVRVWAADPGALDEPIGMSPLVYDETVKADYKRLKAPWGVNLRGNAVEVSLYQRHLLIVGLSNQGKTASVRALALWLALDKNVELRVADLKGAGDWAMFDGLATVLIEGPTDDDVIAATEMLEEGVREMERRLGAGGTWKPLILLVDEAQSAYMCPAKDEAGRPYGGKQNTSRYLTAVRKIQNQGRAVDVVLWQGTQNPTDQNLPVLAREGAHLRICLAVGKKEQSVMALGDKAVDGGAAPHLLRPGLDKGTVVVAGDGAPLSAGQASVTIRTHFISNQDAVVIAERARKLRGPVQQRQPDEVHDLLDDVREAFGSDDKVRAAHLADRLRETFPRYRPYRTLNGTALVALLANAGVIVEPGQGRHFYVRATQILAARG